MSLVHSSSLTLLAEVITCPAEMMRMRKTAWTTGYFVIVQLDECVAVRARHGLPFFSIRNIGGRRGD